MKFLSPEEYARFKVQHRLVRDGRVRDRIKAILLYDKGWHPANGFPISSLKAPHISLISLNRKPLLRLMKSY